MDRKCTQWSGLKLGITPLQKLDIVPIIGVHLGMIFKVEFSKQAKRDVRKIPSFIVDKLETWVDAVERDGLEEVRKLPGYHDELLKGDRKGQRSIRLNRAYRAIYVIVREKIEFVRIEEVTKHEY